MIWYFTYPSLTYW